jgi:hypothetical protein
VAAFRCSRGRITVIGLRARSVCIGQTCGYYVFLTTALDGCKPTPS